MKDSVELCHGPIEELQKKAKRQYNQVLFDTIFKHPLVLEAQVKNASVYKPSTLEKMADELLVWKARLRNVDAIADITYHEKDGIFIAYCFAYNLKPQS